MFSSKSGIIPRFLRIGVGSGIWLGRRLRRLLRPLRVLLMPPGLELELDLDLDLDRDRDRDRRLIKRNETGGVLRGGSTRLFSQGCWIGMLVFLFSPLTDSSLSFSFVWLMCWCSFLGRSWLHFVLSFNAVVLLVRMHAAIPSGSRFLRFASSRVLRMCLM